MEKYKNLDLLVTNLHELSDTQLEQVESLLAKILIGKEFGINVDSNLFTDHDVFDFKYHSYEFNRKRAKEFLDMNYPNLATAQFIDRQGEVLVNGLRYVGEIKGGHRFKMIFCDMKDVFRFLIEIIGGLPQHDFESAYKAFDVWKVASDDKVTIADHELIVKTYATTDHIDIKGLKDWSLKAILEALAEGEKYQKHKIKKQTHPHKL